jgi:hypothetical protein
MRQRVDGQWRTLQRDLETEGIWLAPIAIGRDSKAGSAAWAVTSASKAHPTA